MSYMLIEEQGNLFVGDADPNASLHLVLAEIALPKLEENFTEHNGGGAVMGLDIGVGYKSLSASFKLVGHQDHVMKHFGLGSRVNQSFTYRGAMRDRVSGELKKAVAVITGRLATVEPETFKRGELKHHDYEIKGITRYELKVGGNELYLFDFVSSTWRIGGVDENADVRSILNIPGA